LVVGWAGLVVALAGRCAYAQGPGEAGARDPQAGAERRWAMVGAWVGTAQRSPVTTRRGVVRRDLYLSGIRLGRPLAAGLDYALDWVAEIVPLAVSTQNPLYRQMPVRGPCRDCGAYRAADGVVWEFVRYRTAYAAGGSPLGLQLRLFPQAPARLVLHTNGGALFFSDRIPDFQSTRFNFTAEAGGAVRLPVARGRRLELGYRYHHTSNAGTGRANPGLNAHVLYMGVAASGARFR